MSNVNRSIHFIAAILLSSAFSMIPAREGYSETEIAAREIMDLDCADADGKPSNDFEESDRHISVGRRFYRATMRAYPGAAITCELPNEDPAWDATSAVLTFGLSDGSRPAPIGINVYLDGQPVASQVVNSGSLSVLEIPIPLGFTSSLALEVVCTSPGRCNTWLYFTEAEIQYIRQTPSASEIPLPSDTFIPPSDTFIPPSDSLTPDR